MTQARMDPTTTRPDEQTRDQSTLADARPEADPVTPRSTAPLTATSAEPAAAAPDRTAPDQAPRDRERLTTADLASRDVPQERVDDHAARGTERIAQARPGTSDDGTDDGRAALFDGGAAEELRGRWTEIQTGFVDEPRRAVEDADALVADVMQRLADSFARERQGLEQQWSQGDDASTEDLRLALRRYRSFFDRLLSM